MYHHTWTVWIFPFQLCSIPLYYWIFHRYKDYFHGLFESYILLATIVALIYPEDMIHSELILTIHSFLWHYILIFMAANVHSANFKKGTILFLICCGIATLFNITLSSFGEINMFYIHPWIHTTQPILHTIGLKYGILSKNIVYIGSIIFISFGIHKKKTS